eukprot:CAMPEP_0170545706 /NCGR_PEP_ID=MMETSP0211-20121228/4072_1 /TAXON_ID=311385 /ORGANISM="Pseudokeronopsis sp., Strain OXSARD2" /LENGTH=132 /DNA_ID=CAMNT_0010849755 /DNA_START=22 /DNA_END=416 /DNA_ORIENTATION=-
MKSIIVVLVLEVLVDDLLAGLHEFTSDDHLIQNLIYFVEVEDQVELTDTAEVLVEDLYEQVDELQGGQLVVPSLDTDRKEQTRVPPVDDLVAPKLEEVGVFGVPADDVPVDFHLDFAALGFIVGLVPAGEAG